MRILRETGKEVTMQTERFEIIRMLDILLESLDSNTSSEYKKETILHDVKPSSFEFIIECAKEEILGAYSTDDSYISRKTLLAIASLILEIQRTCPTDPKCEVCPLNDCDNCNDANCVAAELPRLIERMMHNAD